MSNIKPIRLFGLIGVLLSSAVVLSLLYSQKAKAVSWILPDFQQMSADANVHLEIAQRGTLGQITLDAPTTWVKLYFDAGTSNQIGVRMADAKFDCDASSTGFYDYIDTQGNPRQNCTDPAAVDYDIYCGDASGNDPDLSGWNYHINSNDGKINAAAGLGYHQVFDGPSFTITSPCPNISGKYVVYVRARWVDSGPPEGRINGFKVAGSVSGVLASYWAGGSNSYAVQNRIDQMPGQDDYMNFEFAPPCDLSPDPQLASIVWQDADAVNNGGSPGDGNSFGGDIEPSFDLFEGDPGGTGWQTVAHVDSGGTTVGAGYSLGITPANIGGNGDVRQLQFTAKRNKIYSWKWYNVNWDNGVQMTLPYDSYNAAKTACPPPGGGGSTPPAPTVSCMDASGNVSVSWGAAGYSVTNYYVDVDTNSGTFSGGYWNKGPVTSPTTIPSGLGAWGSGSAPPGSFTAGTPYQVRIWYNGPGIPNGGHSDINHFTATPCASPLKPAPVISAVCSGGVLSFIVTWDSANTPGSTTQIFVDVNTTNSFPSSGGYWNRGPLAPPGASNTTGAGGFNGWPSGPAMPAVAPGSQYFSRLYYNVPSGGVYSAVSAQSAPAPTCVPPPQITCINDTTNPAELEPGIPANFSVKAMYQLAGAAAGGGPLQGGAQVKVVFNGTSGTTQSVSPDPLAAGSNATVTGNFTTPSSAGVYPVSLVFNDGNSGNVTVGCPSITIANKPYFRAFGGDVLAGSGVCGPAWAPDTASSPGRILGFNNGNGLGAGTQLMAQALDAINGFSSAQGRASPGPDKGLSLANNTVSLFGGNFGTGNCPPDYYANRRAPSGGFLLPLAGCLPLVPCIGTIDATGTQNLPSILPGLTASGTINPGDSLVVYLKGNAVITGNITYGGASWPTPKDIPNYVLVVEGNIYIDANVTQLDGVYIAQPDPTIPGSGTIYTCYNSNPLFPGPPSLPDIADPAKCGKNRLTITGAVVARTIKLLRTSGTAGDAAANDCPMSMTIYGCPAGSSSQAAEQFIFSPWVWMRANNVTGPTRPSTYDVITNLPPIL